MPGAGAMQVTIVMLSGRQSAIGSRPLAAPLWFASLIAAMSSAATGLDAEAIDMDRGPPADDAGTSDQATAIPASTTTAAPAAISRAGRRRRAAAGAPWRKPGFSHRVDGPPCRLWEV